MGIDPFAANAQLPPGTNPKLPKSTVGPSSGAPNTKLPNDAEASLPKPRLSAAERLRRLEEAKVFLRQHLAAGPQPARSLLKTAKAAGIAERTLHRAKDLLDVTTERAGGYAEHGQWIWYPPPVTGASAMPAAGVRAAAMIPVRR